MDKIRLNGQEFDLVPMGISEKDKKRTFTISSNLPYSDIETAFSNVDRIEHLSESGEVLTVYNDGASIKSISKNIESGTYTIEIGVDAVERALIKLGNDINIVNATIDYVLCEAIPMIIG